MWDYFCCRRGLYPFSSYDQLSTSDSPGTRDKNGLPGIELDISTMGQNVVIVKNGRRICGSGAAVATTAVQQNKAYWEVKIQSSTGNWGVGLATRKCNLNCIPLGRDTESWVLVNGNVITHNNQVLTALSGGDSAQEGDVVGLTYDHVELHFYLNGRCLNCPVNGIRGTVYPVIFVDEGAILDVVFDGFYHSCPLGFSPILLEKQIL